ncbi:hypothetical protein [Streptomyces sp. NPDC088183]|uniref:hypothetical protein n=1 Tax=Streptomyces sp. NPDC088183 TaxID=3160992 RepID=UPI00341913CB
MLQKDNLRQLLTGWLAEYGIPVLVVRGFGSQSYVDVVRDRVAVDPREAVLLVVVDFACSGEDVERDWTARTACWSHTERVLLTYDQVVHDYELPATEVRSSVIRHGTAHGSTGIYGARMTHEPAEMPVRAECDSDWHVHLDHPVPVHSPGVQAAGSDPQDSP